MAVRQKRFAWGTLAASTLTEIYSVSGSVSIHPFLVVTNTSGSAIADFNVTLQTGSTDYKFSALKIAPGDGRALRVLEVSDTRLEQNDSIKLQVTSGGPVNYFLSGTEYDVT